MGALFFQRSGHRHNGRHIFRAAPFSALLGSAFDNIGQQDPLARIQYAGSFWAVKLMGGKGQHVDVLGNYINGQVPGGLHGVSME